MLKLGLASGQDVPIVLLFVHNLDFYHFKDFKVYNLGDKVNQQHQYIIAILFNFCSRFSNITAPVL